MGAAVAEGVTITAWCPACRESRDADLAAIAAAKGEGYSLVNRRFRCTLTPGCRGLVRFHYIHGVGRPLWDDETALRWIWEDRDRAAGS